MEIEVKYQIPDKETARAIWDDELVLELGDPSGREKVVMKASYFDTEDFILSKNKAAFRVRAEGDELVATVKWGGRKKGSLSERGEINVPVSDPAFLLAPSLSVFTESETGRKLMKLVGDRPLFNIVDTRFLRSRARLFYKGSVMELAVDEGIIATDNCTLPISELEIELFAGEADDVVELGEKLAEKYGLKPQPLSKFKRGLMVLE